MTGHGFGVIVTSKALSGQSRVSHGFTGRLDSHAEPLNLGRGVDESTWLRAADLVGASGAPVAFASQVHGREVLHAKRPGLVGEADALICDQPGLLVAMRVADCVPILVAGDGVVAAIHAGWRGLAAGIIPATMAALGTGRWVAAVGPRICVDCYEVGEEVVDGVGTLVPASSFVRRDLGTRPHADLGAAAAHQLKEGGVTEVDVLPVCTRCSARHWSHRQEGQAAGRQAGLVGWMC